MLRSIKLFELPANPFSVGLILTAVICISIYLINSQFDIKQSISLKNFNKCKKQREKEGKRLYDCMTRVKCKKCEKCDEKISTK